MATSFRDFEQLDTLLNKPDDCPLPNGGQPAAAAQGPGSIPAVIDDAVIPKPKAGARRVTVDSLYDRVTYSYSGSLHSVRQKHLGRGGPSRRGRPADRRQRYPASSGIRHTVQARGFGECTLHRPPRTMSTDLDVCERWRRVPGLLPRAGLGKGPKQRMLQRNRGQGSQSTSFVGCFLFFCFCCFTSSPVASGGAAGRYHERPRSRRAENQADSTIEEAVRLRTRCTLQQLGPSLPLRVRSILPLALPYPCDPKNGSAAFDSSTSGEFTPPTARAKCCPSNEQC